MRKLVLLVIAVLLGAVSAALTYQYLVGAHFAAGKAQDTNSDFDTGF